MVDCFYRVLSMWPANMYKCDSEHPSVLHSNTTTLEMKSCKLRSLRLFSKLREITYRLKSNGNVWFHPYRLILELSKKTGFIL